MSDVLFCIGCLGRVEIRVGRGRRDEMGMGEVSGIVDWKIWLRLGVVRMSEGCVERMWWWEGGEWMEGVKGRGGCFWVEKRGEVYVWWLGKRRFGWFWVVVVYFEEICGDVYSLYE